MSADNGFTVTHTGGNHYRVEHGSRPVAGEPVERFNKKRRPKPEPVEHLDRERSPEPELVDDDEFNAAPMTSPAPRTGGPLADEPDELDAGEAVDRGPLGHLIIGGLGLGVAGVFVVSNVLALPFWLVAGGAVAATGVGAAVVHSAKTTRRHGRRPARPVRPPRPAKLGGAGGRRGTGLPKLGLPKLGGSSGRKTAGGPKLGAGRKSTGAGLKLPKLGGSRGAAGSKAGKASKTAGGPAGRKSTGLKMPGFGGRGRAGTGKGVGLLGRKSTGGKGAGLKLPKIGGRAGSGRGAGLLGGRRGATGGPKLGTSRTGGRGLKLPLVGGRGRTSSAAGKTTGAGPRARKLLGLGARGAAAAKARRAARAASNPLTPSRVARLRTIAAGRRQTRAAGVNVTPTRAARRNARAARITQRAANRAQRRATRGAKLRTAARATRATMLTKPATWVGRKMIGGTRTHWRAKAADIWAGQRRWMRVQRIAARRRAAAKWAMLVKRLTPGWATRLRQVARADGRRAAFAAAFIGAFVAIAGFLRSSLWAEPQPRHAATPTPGALPHRPAHQSRGVPPVRPATSTATKPPATTTPRPATPPVPDPTPAPVAAAAAFTTGVPAVHQAHSRMLETTQAFTAQYHPRSVPDLEGYLRSQPAAFRARGEHYGQLADRLAQQFPGAVLVHSFYREFAHGFTSLSDTAVALHTAYRSLHAADLARHEQPRVNEHLADLTPNGGGRGIPTIGDGTVLHENHARIIEASRDWVAGWFPGSDGGDPVRDLLIYLEDQPEALFTEAGQVKALADRLVEQYPIEADLHQYYFNFAGGLARLADQARALEGHYRNANAHDVRRREAPRTNEHWADVSNR